MTSTPGVIVVAAAALTLAACASNPPRPVKSPFEDIPVAKDMSYQAGDSMGDRDAHVAGGARGLPRSDRARKPRDRDSQRTRGQRLAARQHDNESPARHQPGVREASRLP